MRLEAWPGAWTLLKTAIDIFPPPSKVPRRLDQTMGGWPTSCLPRRLLRDGAGGHAFLPAIAPLRGRCVTQRDGSPISLPLIIFLLCVAGIAGDAVNYAIGYRFGPKVFTREDSIW